MAHAYKGEKMPIEENDVEVVGPFDVLNTGREKINDNFELLRRFINQLEVEVVDGGDASTEF